MFAPEAFGADGTLAASPEVAQAIGASTWLSWVVNLLVAEWWLHRARHRRPTPAPADPRPAEPVSEPAAQNP